jgi:hypothetical protein
VPQTRHQRALAAEIVRQCRRLGPKDHVEDLIRKLYEI